MRVFEIAKELKLDTKEVVSILQGMGLPVSSHLSSLNEKQTEEAYKMLRGRKQPEASKKPARKKTVKKEEPAISPKEEKDADEATDVKKRLEEKRVSGTVIRRRKKTEPPEPKVKKETAAEKAEKPVEKIIEKEKPSRIEPAREVQEKEQETEPVEVSDKKPVAKEDKENKRKEKEKGKDAAAKVIAHIDITPQKKEKQDLEEKPGKQELVKVKEEEEPAKPKKLFTKLKDKQKKGKIKWQDDIDEKDNDGVLPTHAVKKVRYKLKDKGRQAGDKRHLQIKKPKEPEKTLPRLEKRRIKIHESITVAELAKRMGIKATEIIRKLIDLGVMATINQVLDYDTASLVASDYSYEVELVPIEEELIFEDQPEEQESDLKSRDPVVTVMGHVDHGKTSLLDTIRETRVVDGEKGGITQHIGAYRVSAGNGNIAFVDTPGHQAFTAMRARGAKVTDIVVLVVAAEEGVKPQTIEAINHAKAANVPIIVAINKIDKPEANPDKVKQELSSYGLISEEWGGENLFVPVSAKQKLGIDKLLEAIMLQAEMLELKANPDKPAKGTIIEARLDKSRGPVATVLVQEGTIRVGDSFVSRRNFGKVKALIDDTGGIIKQAGPSTPVEVLGYSGVPEAGDVFVVVDERKARQTSDYWQQKRRGEDLRKDARISLENFLSTAGKQEVKELRIIIKADVQGSVEVLKRSLEELGNDEIKVQILHASVGAVSLNDIMLASASNAIIIGFGVKAEPKVNEEAESEKVDVRLYSIIYEVIDDVKKAMTGMLSPKLVEKVSGRAEVRDVFNISKYGTVAGCFVLDGKIIMGYNARVLRNSEVVHEGAVTSLKRFKDDAKEVMAGQECGIFLGSFKEFEKGDVIESFIVEELKRTL